jgi:hypothetical protein
MEEEERPMMPRTSRRCGRPRSRATAVARVLVVVVVAVAPIADAFAARAAAAALGKLMIRIAQATAAGGTRWAADTGRRSVRWAQRRRE